MLDAQPIVDVANPPHRRGRILCVSPLMTCANDTLEGYLTTGDAHVDLRRINE